MIEIHDLLDNLKERFFYLTEQGQHRLYWDSHTGETLRTMHLFEHCYQFVQGVGGDINEFAANWKKYDEAITASFFKPIVLTPHYRPEEPAVVNVKGNWHPNSWRPPTVALPKQKLPAKKFVDHLKLMLGSKATADYLLDMLAYRYQNPDYQKFPKPHIAFFFYGEPGMGKGTFTKVIQRVFGESAVKVAPDQSELKGMSSVDLWSRTWLFVEEVDVKRGSTDYNKIKTFVGGNSFDSARKNEHVKTHETPAQLIMFSNSPPTFIEHNDRRFFISKWEHDFASVEEKTNYFEDYYDWLETEEAYPAIAYLLKNRDITHVQIAAPAMMTIEKEEVTTLMRDDAVDDILAEIDDNPAICFVDKDFNEIWENRAINPAARKHKLTLAGFKKTKSKRYYEDKSDGKRATKTLEIWTRPGWTLETKNGVEPVLVSLERKIKLREEAGYKGFWSLDY